MYLGLDLGTSGATALLLGADLDVLGRASRPVHTSSPHPGHIEQDPDALLAAVREVAAEVLEVVPPGVSLAAGFANPGESVLAWDARTGDPLTPVLVWSDTRSSDICGRVRAQGREATVLELSGLRPDPYFCASKFAWLLEHSPETRRAQAEGHLRLSTLDAWIAVQLGGPYVTDHSTASRTQLYDRRGGGWSPELLGLFGVPGETLPDIRPGLSPLGELHLGPHRVPWTAALLDQVAALVGNGCLDAGEVKVTYGTGAFVLAQAGRELVPAPPSLLQTVGLSGDGWREFILDGGVYSAGSALTWLERLGILARAADASELAERATGTRLRFLPALSGLGAPWWQAEARGVLSGLSGQSGPAEVTRAVLDGIASRVTDILEVMGEVLPHLHRVRADGGLAQNRSLIRRQADLSGLRVERSEEHEATALGVALAAGVSAGALGWEQVRDRTSAAEVFTPTLSPSEREQERARWHRWREQAAALPAE